jgi:transcriptional regulator with XRE-family HTH domain
MTTVRVAAGVAAGLLVQARHAAGLSQGELARRAHTSRPTLSAYEHGRKSPTVATAERLLAEAGYQLSAEPRITFTDHLDRRGHQHPVPDRLPRLPLAQAMATVKVPLHLEWSAPGRTVQLYDRHQRARFYEIVLREGGPADVLTYIDGALLVDLWPDIVLPRDIRAAWAPIVEIERR